jgi:large subunit ribosomal protein L23
MKTPYEIIRKPVITEKGLQIKELQRTLVFQVNPKATKPEIKKAVEKIFGVKVESVRTANFLGKFRRQGARGGHRASWKKAYVKLKSGEKMVEYLEQA